MTAILLGSQIVAAAPAQAQEGFLCGFVSITDPTGERDVQTGEVDGGPITAASTDPDSPSADPTASISIKCTIQVGAAGATHAGPDAASATGSGTGWAVLPPTQISYVAPVGAEVVLCSQVTVNGITSYWDDANGRFSSSSSVPCSLGIRQQVGPGTCGTVIITICSDLDVWLLPPWACEMFDLCPPDDAW